MFKKISPRLLVDHFRIIGSMAARVSLVLLCLVCAADSGAQTLACTNGNLLLGRAPTLHSGIERAAAITDGVNAHEGAFWSTSVTGLLRSEESFVVYDLGRLERVGALYVQTDNNDTLQVYGSVDGESYEPLWTVPSVDGQGMRGRTVRGLDAQLRWIRISSPRGDGYFSVGELQIFCRSPAAWPPRIAPAGPRPAAADGADGAEGRFDRWWANREHRLSTHKIAIGLLGLVALCTGMSKRLRRHRIGSLVAPASGAVALAYSIGLTFGATAGALLGAPAAVSVWWIAVRGEAERFERPTLIALLFVGAITWSNFGTFHGSREVHLWDFMHYYVGSKYFDENDYRWFYHCALAAEIDDGRADEVRHRKYRSLVDNRLGPSGEIVAEATEVCRKNFSDERWQAFRQDLRVFRDLMGASWFGDAFEDHGYNASPAWNAIGSRISNLGWDTHLPPVDLAFTPANLSGAKEWKADAIAKRFARDKNRLYRRVIWLARIDAALYVAVFALIVWGFGLRAGAVAIVAWSVGHPWAYYWTGGSFGRVPWLFLAVAGLCFIKRGYAAFGGAGLAGSILLRGFPAALVGGVALRFCWNAVSERRIDRTHLQILAGAVAIIALWGAWSVVSSGTDAWPSFVSNSIKHADTPLTNHMGLATLVAYQPSYSARHLKDSAQDPFARWKKMRRTLGEDRSIWRWAIVLIAVFAFAYVARALEDWEATALATVLVFCLFELTCYYFSYLVILAPFCIRRAGYVAVLIATAIATQIAALSVAWTDEQFVLESAMIGALLAFVLGGEVIRQFREGREGREGRD